MRRKNSHWQLLRKNRHHSPHLQYAWNKYRENNFTFEVVEFVSNVNKLIEREQYWIDYYKSSDDEYGYNISPTAGSTLGIKVSEKTRKLLSLQRKGKKFTKEHKQKISKALKGKPKSEEACRKMSEAQKGKNMGKDNPFFGRHHTPEAIKKIKAAQVGRDYTPERLRMTGKNNPQFGKPLMEKQRKALQEGHAKWLKTSEGLAFLKRNRKRLLGNKLGRKNKGKNRPRLKNPKPLNRRGT